MSPQPGSSADSPSKVWGQRCVPPYSLQYSLFPLSLKTLCRHPAVLNPGMISYSFGGLVSPARGWTMDKIMRRSPSWTSTWQVRANTSGELTDGIQVEQLADDYFLHAALALSLSVSLGHRVVCGVCLLAIYCLSENRIKPPLGRVTRALQVAP